MGCDIHPFLEGRIGKKWFMLCSLLDYRDYDFFSRLSDVRNEDNLEVYFGVVDNYISEEFSDAVRYEYESWGSDAHSLTVMNYSDLVKFWDYLKDMNVSYKNLDSWISVGSKFIPVFDELRVVAWYDN